jgi:hypothetical protein
VIDGAGRLVLAGESTNAAGDLDLVIWRYTPSGTLDISFNGTGYLVHAGAAGGTNGNDAGRGVSVDGSNRIVVAGRSTSPAGTLDMAVWRVVP